jgi:nucleoside 2-deoxyribosyltransferase
MVNTNSLLYKRGQLLKTPETPRNNYPKRMIYLAGPISGLSYDKARYGWRQEFVEVIQNSGMSHISCNSPMRGKEFMQNHGVLSSGHDYPDHAMATPEGITTRDYNDVRECSAMVACFLESGDRPSLGTAAEFGYCWALHKPIIVIGPADEVNVKHIMLKRMAGYRVDTLEEGALIAIQLLTPGI